MVLPHLRTFISHVSDVKGVICEGDDRSLREGCFGICMTDEMCKNILFIKLVLIYSFYKNRYYNVVH